MPRLGGLPSCSTHHRQCDFDADSRRSTAALASVSEIIEKHATVFDRYPGALAARHHELSGGYRRCGDLDRAIAHMTKARRRMPLRASWWLKAGWLRLLRATRPAQSAGVR